MKFIFTFIMILLFVFAQISCSKSYSANNYLLTISGKWNIVTDSFPAGGPSRSHIETYIGREGDYFDFDKDSNLYIKEENQYTTSAYHIISNSTISITDSFQGNNFSVTYNVSNLTEHTVTIALPWLYSPGGILGRSIHLTR